MVDLDQPPVLNLDDIGVIGADPWLDTSLDHPEDIAVHPDGTVYAGGEAGQVYRIDPKTNSVDQIANTGGFVLGLAFSQDGDLYACDFQNQAVFRLPLKDHSLQGQLEVVVSGGEEEPPLHPNYCAFDREGRLYVSDSGRRDKLPGPFEDSGGCLYVIEPDGTGRVLTDELSAFPNGIALSKDGKTLYVCESGTHRVAAVQLDDGEVTSIETVSDDCGLVDGIALDAEDRLYVVSIGHNAIFRLNGGDPTLLVRDPHGQIIGNPTNIAFGGPGLRTLYIANLALWHVSKIENDYQGRHPTGRI